MDIPDLNTALRGLRWALTGAAAARLYMPERATADVDIVVKGSDAATAREALRAADYGYRSELGIGGSSWSSPGRVPINVIELAYPWTDVGLGGRPAADVPQHRSARLTRPSAQPTSSS